MTRLSVELYGAPLEDSPHAARLAPGSTRLPLLIFAGIAAAASVDTQTFGARREIYRRC